MISRKAIQSGMPEDWGDTVPRIRRHSFSNEGVRTEKQNHDTQNIVVSLGRQLSDELLYREIVATLSRQLLDGFGLRDRKIVVTLSRQLSLSHFHSTFCQKTCSEAY